MSYEQGGAPTEPPEEDKPKDGEQAIAQFDPDAPNLVPFFLGDPEDNDPAHPGKRFLEEAAKQACDDTNQGWDDSEEHRQHRKKLNSLYVGYLKTKTMPYVGCANIHLPVMLERVQRVVANVYTEIFTDRDLIYGVKSTGPDDDETAEILTVHGNWRLRNEMVDFLPAMEEALTEFFLAGSVIAYSYRDTVNNVNCHDVLGPDEYALPYVFKSRYIDMRDLPWKTRILRKFKPELEDLRDSGEWAQVDTVLKEGPPSNDFMTTVVRDAGEQVEGIRKPTEPNARNAPYVFFEYHGKLRMPGENYRRPVKITVSADRKIVVHFQVREKNDWKDLMRHERETAELGQFQAESESFPARQQEFEAASRHYAQMMSQTHMMPDGSTMPGPPMMMDPMGQPIPPPPPPEAPTPPTPPAWAQPDGETGGLLPPKPVRRVPIEMWSHGRYSYNPAGMLGLGMGHILKPFNEAADEAMNRFYDQATASNGPALLTTQDIGISGPKALVPNQIVQLKNVTDDINKVIKEYRPGTANPQLLDIVRNVNEWSDGAVAAPGILSGQPGKSGETFRGVATRAEKASKQLTAGAQRFCLFEENILRNDAELLATFMDEEEIVQVNDHLADYRKSTKGQGELRITRDMYRRKFDVSFAADMQFTSRAQKIAEADEILAMVNSVFPFPRPDLPPGSGDQMAALRYHAVADALRARGKQDMIILLGEVPPAPAEPMGSPVPLQPPMAMGPDGQPMPPDGSIPGPPQPDAPPPEVAAA